MTTEERAIDILRRLSHPEHYDFDGDEVLVITGYLQAERNQALEEAITVVSNVALKNELAQLIRDLK